MSIISLVHHAHHLSHHAPTTLVRERRVVSRRTTLALATTFARHLPRGICNPKEHAARRSQLSRSAGPTPVRTRSTSHISHPFWFKDTCFKDTRRKNDRSCAAFVFLADNISDPAKQDAGNTVTDSKISSVAAEFHGAPGVAVFYARGTALVRTTWPFCRRYHRP